MRRFLTLFCLMPFCGFAQGFSDGSAPYLLSTSSLRKGLVGYWRLEEGSGTHYDCSPYGNHLTPFNNVGSEPAKVGVGYSSTWTNNYLTHADSASLRMGNADYTICFWVLFYNRDDFGFCVSKDDSATSGARDYSIYYRLTTSKLTYVAFKATDSQVLVDSIVPTTNIWYFVACWHDAAGGTINMQVNNGTVYSTATAGNLQAAGASPFYLGGRHLKIAGLFGRLDEVGIWKRLLTAAELTQLYNAGNGATFPRFKSVTPGLRGWTRLADMPEAKEQHGFEAYNGLLYAVGGASLPGPWATNTVYAYNPATDTWTAKASTPKPMQSPILRAAGGKLYCIGGKATDVNCTNWVFQYDDALDSWTTKTPMPIGVEDMASGVISNRWIYLNGGYQNMTTYPIPAILQVYDTTTDIWTTNRASNPLPRASGDHGAAYNDEFYIVGSVYNAASYPIIICTNSVAKYNPVSDTWTALAACGVGTAYKEVEVLNGKLYCVGGVTTYNNIGYGWVQEYNVAGNSWKYKTPTPVQIYGEGLATDGVSIYMSGGDTGNNTDTKQFWRYDPAGDP